MFYKVKRFFNKIKKIFEYVPVLWKDEDWDYEYAVDLLEYKLRRIKDCLERNNILSESDMNEVTIRIDETLAKIYCYKYAYEIYDDCPINIGHITVPSPNHEGCYQMITINKDTWLPLTEEEDELYTKYIQDKMKFEQDSWKGIWDTIKEHGQRWWD